MDDYYITPLVTHVNIDKCQKKKKWRPDVQSFDTQTRSDFLFFKNIITGCGFYYVKKKMSSFNLQVV